MYERWFDLNIERVLEHWTVAHALREVIANALDEQALTTTSAPQIFQDADGAWHVRDFGRGLRIEHLTQNESNEKLVHPSLVIGKFGIGLKDALATFDRHGIQVTILTRHGDMTIGKMPKHGFEDISTLHVRIMRPSNPNRVGTEVILHGVTDGDIDEAKEFFLRFSGEEILETTPYGRVIRRVPSQSARIYVNGLRVAEEDCFLL